MTEHPRKHRNPPLALSVLEPAEQSLQVVEPTPAAYLPAAQSEQVSPPVPVEPAGQRPHMVTAPAMAKVPAPQVPQPAAPSLQAAAVAPSREAEPCSRKWHQRLLVREFSR